MVEISSKVVFLIESFNLGGSERQVLNLACYLKKHAGADVEIGAFLNEGPVLDMAEHYGVKCRVLPFCWSRNFKRILRGLYNLTRMLRNLEPQVLVPFTRFPNMACGLIWRFTGAKTCIWNQRDMCEGMDGSRVERWAIANIPFFVSNSRDVADLMMMKYDMSSERMYVIRNSVELQSAEISREIWRQKENISDKTFVACMLAKLHSNKDHEILLRAWRKVQDACEDLVCKPVLLLAGRDYGMMTKLKAFARNLGMPSLSVRFTGHVGDVASLLNAVDLCVFSSRAEGCPNGVLECMAAGLPVAATDIPGVREAVGPRGYEYLAPVGDAAKMADLILKFMNDPGLRRKEGEANRERIRAEFSVERMCKEYVDLIRKHGGLDGEF